jgi:phosphoglycolate phosphatase-like HAD superfamily hydrolase
MITTVVFDLDDTLYDEVEYCKSGFEAIAEFLANLPEAPRLKGQVEYCKSGFEAIAEFLANVPEAPPAERIFGAFWKQFKAGNRTKTFNVALDELDINCDDAGQPGRPLTAKRQIYVSSPNGWFPAGPAIKSAGIGNRKIF